MLTRLKIVVFLACLIPLGQLLYNAWAGDLTPNPIEYITHFTGDWSLIFLLATLSVTPLRKIFGWNEIIKLRRMLGLFAFFYVLLHFSTYMVLDHFFDFERIVKDVYKRPYVTAGFTAFVLLIPLAATSTAAMIRKLGKRWQQLHRGEEGKLNALTQVIFGARIADTCLELIEHRVRIGRQVDQWREV